MGHFNLTRLNQYPEGTTVAAYPVTNFHDRTSDPSPAAPTGTATESQDVTDGVAAFVALGAAGTAYWLHAEIGGVHRYIKGVANA